MRLPLSHGQEAIWFVQQMDPTSSAYNAHASARILSPINVPTLRRAFEMLTARHELLRARFLDDEGSPVQEIAREMPVEFTYRQAPSASLDELLALAKQEYQRPIDLAHGPAARLALFSTAPEHHALVLTIHHIIADLASCALLLDELCRIYAALAKGQRPELPPVSRSFRDYVEWHARLLGSPEGDAMRRYWREELKDHTPVLDLPSDRPRRADLGWEGNTHAFSLPASTRGRVRALAEQCGASPFMVLFAAYAALLGRYAGQLELVIGSPVPGRRSDKALECVVGSFMNMLPLRVDLSGAPSFLEIVARTRRTVEKGRANQEYPFSKMVQDVGGKREPGASPVFQTLFTLQRAPKEEMSAFFVHAGKEVRVSYGDLTISPLPMSQQEGQLDLALELVEVAGAYHAELKHKTALFDASTIEQMASSYGTLLDAALDAPQLPLAELPLLTPEQHMRALDAGRGATALQAEPTFVGLFDAQAARTPNAIAVRASDATLSYAALQERATRIAKGLCAKGIGKDQVVGIAMERGASLLLAMLGVLKAGGAFVALDLEHPLARNAEILERAEVRGILTTQAHLQVGAALREQMTAKPWAETIEDLAARAVDVAPLSAPSPEHLAYVIFTSGSTGKPKGAMVEHRGMLNHLRAKNEDLSLSERDIVAQTAPQSFVIANWQFLAGLLVGAEIHIVERAVAMDPSALLQRLQTARVSILQPVPSLLRAMLEEIESHARGAVKLPDLRWLVPTGEALPAELCRRWLAAFPSIPLLNAYGCSECSDDVAHQPVRTPPALHPAIIPIGKPVRGALLYVLDEQRKPVPTNVVGDLWVGGEAVGRGYLGDPAQTQAVFVRDPFAATRDARMYRTGDRVRRRIDGTLEYLGRADHQVKVRGVRIELGEIEAALREQSAVGDAAVSAEADAIQGARLVAHLVAKEGETVDPAAIRASLSARLPSAMVPAAFLVHASLPKNAHGKLDRRALLALAKAAPRVEEKLDTAESLSPREEELSALWAELLGVPRVGKHDDFFALGGHSLLAVRLMVRLRERYGVTMPLAAIFEVSTIALLARALEAQQAKPQEPETNVPFVMARDALSEPFPLTDLQQAYWIGQSALIEGKTPSVAYLENEITDLDVPRFERAMQRLIERHPMLRAVIRADGRQQVQKQVPAFQLVLHDVRGKSDDAIAESLARVRQALSDAGPQPDTWPMLRIEAHRLTDRQTRLHIGFPLLLGDLQSFRVLNRDLGLFYRDPSATLPPIEPTFRDYVEHLIAARRAGAYAKAEAYWRGRIDTLPPAPELPVLRTMPAEATFQRWQGTLKPKQWARIKQRAQQRGLTNTSIVAAAYAEAIGAFSRSRHFSLNLLYQNRKALHPDIQEVIGNFSTTILLEVDGRAAESFEARARRLQMQLFRDLEHTEVSGVEVVRELAQARGDRMAGSMPIVLASTLHLGAEAFDEEHLLGRPVSDKLRTAHVWIDHQASETREGLRFHWDVRDGIFPPGLIDAMFAAYADLLTQLAEGEAWESPSPVRLPPSELDARRAANATEARISSALLHELFAEQVTKRPDAIAVIAPEQTLTYGELARRANALGARLRELGAKPGRLVAISMRKGWEQVVAALGILVSGAAYLPIDPELPSERMRYLVEHAEVELILTQSALMDRVDWPESTSRIAVDQGPIDAEVRPLRSMQRATDLAYVIFTSGSTGLPKGVMIDHRGAVGTILDINERFRVGPSDRALALSSLSFDLSVYDVFGMLAAGGAIVFPAADRAREPGHWARLVRGHRITIWNSVPQLMQLCVDHEEQTKSEGLPSLRVVLMSGDWIPVSLPARIWAVAKNAATISLGGATEGSIWSILHPIDSVDPSMQSIPYGKPMRNQRFHVLNDRLEPCPTWTPGELFIGGVGVALGYLRDPKRTEERFFNHPITGERLYRTGDLGRYLPDGNIEFLGRADFQVKVQGFRVELGEIEATLAEHPAVKACVVSAVGPARGEKRLVAYVVAEGEEHLVVEDLRAHLAAKLPAYMVPATFVPLASLPLSSNGKVDRKALPSPEQAQTSAAPRVHVAPRSEIEKTLARLFGEVLEAKDVGIHDDFFADLGGNSFAAVRLLARMEAVLGRPTSLASLLAAPTVAAQASALAQSRREASWSPLVTLADGGAKTPLFLVHPIGGNVLCYRDLGARLSLASDRPVYGLAARGFAEGQDPFGSMDEMAQAYADAIVAKQPQGPYLLGGWSMGALVSHAIARVLEAQGRKVELLVALDGATPSHTPRQNELSLLGWFMRDLIGSAGRERPRLPMDMIAGLAKEERLGALLAWAREKGFLSADTTLAPVERLFRVFLAHHAAMASYAPVPTHAAVHLLDAADELKPDHAARWAKVSARLTQQALPGDHYSMLFPERLDGVVRAMQQAIASAAFEAGRAA